jgi:hypothetical protein
MRSAASLLSKTSRVASYLGVVCLSVSALGAKVVHAKTTSAAMALGEPLGNVDLAANGATSLDVNGQRLQLATARVDGSVHEVLDRLERGCRTHADGLADDLGHIEGLMTEPTSERGVPGVGLLRDEREGRGVVVCFAPGQEVGPSGLLGRVRTFLESHDLRDIGGVRYVTVRADDHGKSRVTAIWSDDALSLDAMFPTEGDAIGSDPAAAPRPDGTRRLLSARVEPSRYGVFVYETDAGTDAAAALARYDAAITKHRGFEPVLGADPSEHRRVYRRGLVDVLVTASESPRGTTLSVVESHYAESTVSVP